MFALSLFISISYFYFLNCLRVSYRHLNPSPLNTSCISKEQRHPLTLHDYHVQGIWHEYSAIQILLLTPISFIVFVSPFFLVFFLPSLPFPSLLTSFFSPSFSLSLFSPSVSPPSISFSFELCFAFSCHDLLCTFNIKYLQTLTFFSISQFSSTLEFQASFPILSLPPSVLNYFTRNCGLNFQASPSWRRVHLSYLVS